MLALSCNRKKGTFLLAIFTLPLYRTTEPYFVNAELTSRSPASLHAYFLSPVLWLCVLNGFGTASSHSCRRKELETYGQTLFLAPIRQTLLMDPKKARNNSNTSVQNRNMLAFLLSNPVCLNTAATAPCFNAPIGAAVPPQSCRGWSIFIPIHGRQTWEYSPQSCSC